MECTSVCTPHARMQQAPHNGAACLPPTSPLGGHTCKAVPKATVANRAPGRRSPRLRPAAPRAVSGHAGSCMQMNSTSPGAAQRTRKKPRPSKKPGGGAENPGRLPSTYSAPGAAPGQPQAPERRNAHRKRPCAARRAQGARTHNNWRSHSNPQRPQRPAHSTTNIGVKRP